MKLSLIQAFPIVNSKLKGTNIHHWEGMGIKSVEEKLFMLEKAVLWSLLKI